VPSHTSRALATLAVVGIASGSAALAPNPAAAHPFGDPQTVTVTPDGQRPDMVRVTWRVGGPDDLTLLGVSLGLLPRDRTRADGTVDYRYTDPGVVGASAAFTGYLLDRITVTGADARPCAGDVEPIHALALKGATVDYVCPGPVATATVAVRMLTDLNPAYRALATGPSGQRAVYDSAAESHAWTLVGVPPVAGTGRSALWQLAVVVGVLLLAVAAGPAILRRRRVTA
jgi:hypothetical protein